MANTNGFIKMAVGALVVIIVAVGVVLPLFSSAEITAGDAVHYSNVQDGYTYKLTEKTETVTVAITGTDGEVQYNGETIADTGFAIVTDSVSVRAGSDYLMVATPDGANDWRIAYNSAYTVEFDEGTCTLTNTANSAVVGTYTYNWMYSPDSAGEWVTVTGGTTHYVNSIKDVIACGYYSTGENDTGYLMYNGVVTLDQDYAAENKSVLTLVDGTTDVYTAVITLGVGDESFTPWFILIKGDIDGHATSGLTYTIVSILPVIILVGVLMMVVTAFISNRRA